jgi:predicted XRE-type DNA-binding protein
MVVTPRQSLVLRWYYRRGLKQHEIATRLGISQPCVSRCLMRAKLRLRRRGLDLDTISIDAIHDATDALCLRDDDEW